jgi:glutathione S-transferase
MLTLYFSPGSSAMATHIALPEVGAAFEARPTLLYQNAHRSREYLAINAEGKVPTLVIDGRPLTEVAATLWYLARQYPDAGLLPQQGDLEAEARVISWMSFIASTIHPATRSDRWREVFEIAELLGARHRHRRAPVPAAQAQRQATGRAPRDGPRRDRPRGPEICRRARPRSRLLGPLDAGDVHHHGA